MSASIWLPKGERGDKGPIGDKGPDGDKGPPGEPGEDSVDQQLRDILQDPELAAEYIKVDDTKEYTEGSLGQAIAKNRNHFINVQSFGAIGDGITDDSNAIQAALDAALLTGGLLFGYNKTYRITKQLAITSPLRVDLNGAQLVFNFGEPLANGVGFAVQSNQVTIENGSIKIQGTTPGLASSAHVPIYTGNEANGAGFSDLIFRNLYLETNGNGAIVGMGETKNVLVENIVIADSPTIRIGVGFEWGGTEETGTGHPHNIVIKNIRCGKFTYAQGDFGVNHTCAVWLSSVFNVKIENVFIEETHTVINIFTGDRSNINAPAKYKDLVGTAITVDNVVCNKVNGYGIRIYGLATYSPDPLPQSAVITNVTFKGTTSDLNTHMGILLGYCDGVSLKNFDISGFYYGIITEADVLNFTAETGKIHSNRYCAAQIGSTGHPAINTTFRDVKAYNNNTLGTAGINTATAFVVTDAKNTSFENCRVGIDGETETSKYGFFATLAARKIRFYNNHVNSLAAEGVCYVMGESQGDTQVEPMGANNTGAPGILKSGGTPIMTLTVTGNKFGSFDAIPVAGTYSRGDRIYFNNPSAAGHIGAVCTTGGTPGTWKNFGAIVA